MTSPFTNKEKEKIIFDIADIRMHMNILNDETGELRDIVKDIRAEFSKSVSKNADNIACINVKMSQVQNDVDWIKRTYWIIATASIGALVTGVFNVFERMQ